MIKGVIFDAGGVLHESNTAVTDDLKQELGISDETLRQIWKEYIPDLGSGKDNEKQFWQKVSQKYAIREVHESENLLGRAFEQQLKPFPEVQDLIKQLHEKHYKLIVLSNTIEAHARALREENLYDGFDIVLLSHEVGMRKPDAQIFTLAISESGLPPEELLFIDDDQSNVQVFEKMGGHGIIAKKPEQIVNDVKNLLGL